MGGRRSSVAVCLFLILAGLVASIIWLPSSAKISAQEAAQSSERATEQAAQSDVSAVAALQRAVAAYGHLSGQEPISDFTAQGTITYFWAGQEVQGAATVRGRAPDQFRLDASLPEGTRSYVLAHGQGLLKTSDTQIKQLAFHNTIDEGMPILPSLTLAAWLADPLTVARDLGLVRQEDGRRLRGVRLERHFTPAVDPDASLAKLCVTEYYLDPATGLVAKTINQTHPEQTFTRSYAHGIDLEKYEETDGVRVPTLVREKVDGQTIWELRLDRVTFNGGLAEADFAIR